MDSPCIKLLRLGRKSYTDALRIQDQIASKLKSQLESKSKPDNTLIFVEHEPVYTIGIRTSNYDVKQQQQLEKLGASFVRSDRGGLITFHGPGQLVVYPIIHLHSFQVARTVRSYVYQLEQSIINTCRKFGVETERTADTGVWLKGRDFKIAAIGIHCSRYVTTHGLALNCDTDLTWFEHIVPCGLAGKGVTSLSRELGAKVSIGDVEPVYVEAFEQVFRCRVEK
ncbi:putative lipoyltransferase 2, mitochondrial [Galendromus occidentalis]|uniref:Octanoyl-[acyl-carrier-protein]:protein N-octanoyltransferase LIPT2, mitochondrial n=1 Tax=Galendromus occidentalis TaxID=34638 RepID=A0AAJ6QLX2_9ACAR|nr:putative lipoyltransferase 2, mitochondrial [Galendromus occidentalis]